MTDETSFNEMRRGGSFFGDLPESLLHKSEKPKDYELASATKRLGCRKAPAPLSEALVGHSHKTRIHWLYHSCKTPQRRINQSLNLTSSLCEKRKSHPLMLILAWGGGSVSCLKDSYYSLEIRSSGGLSS